MKRHTRFALTTFFLLLGTSGTSLFAIDYGLVLDAAVNYGSAEGLANPGIEKLDFSGILRPWVDIPLNENMDLHISAGFSLKYEQEEMAAAPELYHTEFTWRPREAQYLGIGRLYYCDPLEFIAEGFFDGAAWASPLGNGELSLGAYYTGLLYKKTANITVTDDELASYSSKLAYGDFADSYFAPKRILGIAGYSMILGDDLRLNFALLGQFDLNGNEEYYSSEYFVVRAVYPLGDFILEAGGTAEIIETSGESVLFGLVGVLGASWKLPGSLQDQLSLRGRYASGRWGNSAMAEFRPLTTETQGQVLRAKFSGLTIIEAEYIARLHKTFALDLSAAYFIQNDLGTYQGYFASATDYLLGADVYAQFIWNPVSDLRCGLGGGAFLPGLGNTSSDSKPLWRINLSITTTVL
jgi:hypothetical protein